MPENTSTAKAAPKKAAAKKAETIVTLADGTKYTFAGPFDPQRNFNPDMQLLTLPDGTQVAWAEVATIEEK